MVTLTTCLVAEPQQYINQVHFSPLFYRLGRHTDTQLLGVVRWRRQTQIKYVSQLRGKRTCFLNYR